MIQVSCMSCNFLRAHVRQARLGNPPDGAALVFNCQMGRGRTTTGMVIASLLQLRRRMSGATLPLQPLRELAPAAWQPAPRLHCITIWA